MSDLITDRLSRVLTRWVKAFAHDLPVNKKLLWSFGGLLTCVGLAGAAVLQQFSEAETDISEYRDATRANVAAEEALGEFMSMRLAARDLVTATNARDAEAASRYRERLRHAAGLAVKELRAARAELGSDPLAARLTSLEPLVERYLQLAWSAAPDDAGVRHEIADRLSFELNNIAELLTMRRDAIGPRLEADTHAAHFASIIATLAILLAGCALLLALRNTIGAPLTDLARRLREGRQFDGDILLRNDEIGAAAVAANAYLEQVSASINSESRKRDISDLVSHMWTERITSGATAGALTHAVQGVLRLFGGRLAMVHEIVLDDAGAVASTVLCRCAAPGETFPAVIALNTVEIVWGDRLSDTQRHLIEDCLREAPQFGDRVGDTDEEPRWIGVPLLVGAELMGVLVLDGTTRIIGGEGEEWTQVVSAMGELLLAQRDADRSFRAEAQAHRLSRQDALTGLANRRTLAEAFEGRTDHPSAKFALVMVDLDRFKPINDTHGHVIGDQVLRIVAERLRGAAQGDCDVIRLGGDEFAIFSAATGRPMETARAEAAALAARVLQSLSGPIAIGDLRLAVGASIGVAMYPDDARDMENLLQFADTSMYRAKERRGEMQFFDASVDAVIQTRSALEIELREAIEAGAVVPFYQPVVCLRTGAVIGHEVLARWRHAERGFIPPASFIPIAERAGLIDAMFWRLLRTACTEHLEAGCKTQLSVNLAPTQICDPSFVQKLLQALFQVGFPPSRLEVEVTESDVIGDSDKARAMLLSLKSQGVNIALDDFGTGYSSLLVLRDLPIDKIKIDRSFVAGLTAKQGADKTIIDAILGMARALNLDVTAEGIESEAVAKLLRRKGCQNGQGYFFGAAQPAFGVDATSTRVRVVAAR
jgi:diguanylate cyclase (GGDEF)-like protein